VVGPDDMRRWDAHAVCHSSDPSGAAMALMEHPHGMSAGRRLTARPAQYAQYLFYLFKCFQSDSNLNRSKDGLSMLENFQIKYGIVGN
jgi:hypothetical protein